MKKLLGIATLLFFQILLSQNVVLNKVEKTGNFEDKFFYKINPDSVQADYLGEIEVQGYTEDDEAIFNTIYKKAKSIGANAFSFKAFESISGEVLKLDPYQYKLSLYEVTKENLPDHSDRLYLISAASKIQSTSINNKIIKLNPRSYYVQKMLPGELYTISTRKLLGSTVKIRSNSSEGAQIFAISSFKIKSNSYGNAGINLKSGDIVKLEKSYGDFLTTIYSEIGH